MRFISITNQKGGSGKTTTSVNLSAALAIRGKKVLLIDLDPQAHSTIHLGFKPNDLNVTINDVFSDLASAKEAILACSTKNLFLLPSNIELSGAEIEMAGLPGRESILKEKISDIKKEYDYVLIDCPPSLGLLTLNALNACQEVFISIQSEFFALEGMGKLLQTINIVKERLNNRLEITGIIITIYDHRKNLCRDVAVKIEEYFGNKVFKTKIRDNVRIAEAPSYGVPVIIYDPQSYGSIDYQDLAMEVISNEKEKRSG